MFSLIFPQNENIPIKLNTAAILREGKLYHERESEQLKKWDTCIVYMFQFIFFVV